MFRATSHEITRRDVLRSLSAFTVTGLVTAPQTVAASEPELHLRVAETVKSLVGTRDVTLRLLLPDGSDGNVTPVIAAFSELTGVKIEVRQAAVDDINTELSLDALSNSRSYDIALPATFGLPDLVATDVILPLTEFAERHEPEGFRDGILYDVGDRFDGQLYGFQTDGDAYVMFYNAEFLDDTDTQKRYADQFGTPLDVPQTWEELDRQMAFFHDPDAQTYGGLLFRTPGYLAWEWWVRFHAKGLWPFSRDMQPQIATDEGIAALEDMIRATEHLHLDARFLGLFENWQRYSEGGIYCNIGWGGTQKYLNSDASAMKGKMRYGPTPGGVIDGAKLITPYFNWGWSYVVARNSQSPEIAYLFTLFASSPVMSTLSVRQSDGFFDPFRAEHYEDPGIQDAYTPEFLAIHKDSLSNAIPDLYLKDQGEYFRVLSNALNLAMTGEMSASEALTRAARQWHLITSTAGQDVQSRRWARLRRKYPAHIRSQLRDLV